MRSTFLLCAAALLMLTGCQQSDSKATSEIDTSYAKEYDGNPQIPDDRTLTKQDDAVQAEKGFLTVDAANFQTETVHIGDVTLTIHDTKRITLEPDYSMIDYFHMLTEDSEFTLVKAFVTIENKGDEPVIFSPVAQIESTHDTQTYERDVYLDDVTGKLQPNETKSGNIGYIVDPSVKKWTVQTTSVYDVHEKIIAEPKTYTLNPY